MLLILVTYLTDNYCLLSTLYQLIKLTPFIPWLGSEMNLLQVRLLGHVLTKSAYRISDLQGRCYVICVNIVL